MATQTPLARYQARLARVLAHVERNLDGDLCVETLAGVAAFSPFHFHRQFGASLGLPVHRYVKLSRLKRAAFRLAHRANPVTQIAMDAGYDSPDAFARAFRAEFGASPTAFRAAPDWALLDAAFTRLSHVRSQVMPTTFTAADVEIIIVPPTPVAMMEHRGSPALVGRTVQAFIAWRRKAGLIPPHSTTWNLFPLDPETTPPNEYRMTLCAGTDRPVAVDGDVINGEIPGGRVARLRLVGSPHDLGPSSTWLYRDWLPASGEEMRDFPFYVQRVRFFPDVPEHEAVTDLFLPLA